MIKINDHLNQSWYFSIPFAWTVMFSHVKTLCYCNDNEGWKKKTIQKKNGNASGLRMASCRKI